MTGWGEVKLVSTSGLKLKIMLRDRRDRVGKVRTTVNMEDRTFPKSRDVISLIYLTEESKRKLIGQRQLVDVVIFKQTNQTLYNYSNSFGVRSETERWNHWNCLNCCPCCMHHSVQPKLLSQQKEDSDPRAESQCLLFLFHFENKLPSSEEGAANAASMLTQYPR